MDSNIEKYRKIKSRFENNIEKVQYCLGKKLEDGVYMIDRRKDKCDFSFSTRQHHSSKPIFLDAYYGYYGDSGVSIFDDEFYISCLTEALNTMIPTIITKTEKIMEQKRNDALIEAKNEAENILKEIEEFEQK